MDELLQGSDEIKSIYSKFFDGLKSSVSQDFSEKNVNDLVDEYLVELDSPKLPDNLEQVLWLGEKTFSVPEKIEEVEKLVKDEANKLTRIELAELAQDEEVSSLMANHVDPFEPVVFSEEELKKQDYLHGEIQFSLKSEVVKKNPALLMEELEDMPEPRDNAVIETNSAIVNNFLAEIEAAEKVLGKKERLDLSSTFIVPKKPMHDPMSFVHDLAVRNMFGIAMKPILDDNAQIVGVKQVWEKAVDAKSAAKTMKYERFPDPSIPTQLKGNGLEVPLDIANIGQIVSAPKENDKCFTEEEKFVDFQVLLKLSDDSNARWPTILETEPIQEEISEAETIKAPTIQIENANVFDIMNFLNESKPEALEISNEEADISQFVKKKKKSKKLVEESLPPTLEEQFKLFEKQEDVQQILAEPAKPVLASVDDKYEFAVTLDVQTDVPEFLKMKHNLARIYPFELDPFQQQAVVAMENGNSVFVAAHTSAGKTVVAEYAIALSRKHRSRVVYTSPIKALSNQKFRDFKNQFEDVGLITGDIQLNTEASCLVMTTEILKSMLYNGRVSPDELEWVIFDEVHYINDAERGHVWEEVLIMLPTQVNIVMLSATVPNCLEFADWVGRIKNRKIYVVQTLYRPVPLAHHIYCGRDKKSIDNLFVIMDRKGEFNQINYKKACDAQMAIVSKKNQGPGRNGAQKSNYVPKHLERSHYSTLIRYLEKENFLPAVAFVFSRQRCNDYADLLFHIDLTTNEEKVAVKRLFTKYLDSFKGSDKNLPQVLKMQQLCYRGFAIHHSGILPILKELVEILFQRGYVKFLFATETFAMGVNMPARTVVFDSVEKFDGTRRRNLNCTEYIQMAGRAGRRGIDDTGVVIILSKGQTLLDHSTLLPMLRGKPVSLESKFRITYNMLLNILRAEELNIEDMLQRSYVERVSLRNMAGRKEQIIKLEEELKSLTKLECSDCYPGNDYGLSVECFHDSIIQYVQQRSILLPKIIISNYSSLLQPGKYLIISIPEKNLTGLLVCVFRFSYNAAENLSDLEVVTLAPKTETNESTFSTLSEIEKKYFVDNLMFKSAIKYGLEAVIDNNQIPEKLISLKNVPLENITAICRKKSKFMMEKEISTYLQEQSKMAGRKNSPSRIVSNFMTEMNSLIRTNSQKMDETFFNKIGEDLILKEIDIHQQIMEFARLREKLIKENSFPCRNCLDFDDHLEKTRHKKLLEEKQQQLTFQTSMGALLLSEDYQNCLKVLRELNFIDKDNIVALKGRVAAQINEDTLLLTELIFENKLQHRGCSEIAAMLCCLTAQYNAAKEKINERECRILTKVANLDVINILKTEMADMADKIDAVERKYSVTEARKGQEPTFGLMEAVYQWAEGMSFEQITHLTEAHEGLIVRCIQRLDEILKDVRNAGRIIGDSALVQKMEDTSAAIRRDIVFAASLYTADE